MDQEAQIQAIVDKLTGAPPESLPPVYALGEPWRTVYHGVRRAGTLAEAQLLIGRAAAGLDNRQEVASELLDRLPPDKAFHTYPSLREIAEGFSEVEWLWPYWIPRGMVTLLGAAPGAGKSLVALDLARRVIHGEAFPDGAPCPCPGANVLIVDAEGAPDLLNERAGAWGIDDRRLYLMQAPNRTGMIDLSHHLQQKTFNEMCHWLEPALVVVDSLGAASSRGEASLQSAREMMGFLSAVARRERLALLVIHHLRKRSSSRRGAGAGRVAGAAQVAADDLRGSSHLSAAARSVMALSILGVQAADEGQPVEGGGSRFDGPRLLEIVKTNLCRYPPPLGLVIEGDGLGVPTLRYTEYVEPAAQSTQAELCAGWLHEYLDAAGEPVKPADAVRAAAEAGFPRHTVYRALKILGGLVVHQGTGPYDPNKRWALVYTIPEIDIKKR